MADLPTAPHRVGFIALVTAGHLAPLEEEGQADTAEKAEGRRGGSRTHPQFVLKATNIQPLVAFAFDAPMFSPGGQKLFGAQLLGWAAGDHVVAMDSRLSFLGDFPNDQAQLGRARQAQLYGGSIAHNESAFLPASALEFLGLCQAIKLGVARGLLRG